MVDLTSNYKVYIGETASLSYLEWLRRVVKQRLGPCAFTEGEFNNFMLENDIFGNRNGQINELPLDAKRLFVRCFLDVVRKSEGLILTTQTPNVPLLDMRHLRLV